MPTEIKLPVIIVRIAESADFRRKNLLIENWRNFNGSNMDRGPEEGH